MTSDTGGGQLVLVVLSREQREAYATEFERFRRPGIELRFEESPEVGIDIVKASAPALVIVGMTVGMMEGLEFVALLLRARRDFQGKVVVLPDKGDPFPPVVHARVAATGKSTTENIDLAGVEGLVMALAASTRPDPLEAAKPPAPAQPVQPPAPIAPAPAPQPEKVAPSPAAGARAHPAVAARPQAPLQTGLAGAGRDQALAPRLAPRPAPSLRGQIQKATTPASPDKLPTRAPLDGAQPSGASALASPAEARRDRAHPSGPDWLSQALTIPVARGDEPRILAAMPPVPQGPTQVVTVPAPKGPSQALTVPAPHLDELARTSADVPIPDGHPVAPLATALASSQSQTLSQSVAQPHGPSVEADVEGSAPVPTLALPSWLPKWLPKQPRERLVVAVSVVALLAIVAAAIAAATMSDRPSSAVPDTQSAPGNSHH